VRIRYPDFPGNDVTYTYGPAGATANAAGRVVRVTDESGTEERTYGKLGEVVSETKSVASATGPAPEVYRTEYLYDTFSRLQQLVYPDGETLTPPTTRAGRCAAVSGRQGRPSATCGGGNTTSSVTAPSRGGERTRTVETYRPDNLRLGERGRPGARRHALPQPG
jgi:YD repeat-containing protein